MVTGARRSLTTSHPDSAPGPATCDHQEVQRELGRRRLTTVTGAVGVGAAAIAALVGFTRPAPVHHTPTTHDESSTNDGTDGGSGSDGQTGHRRGHRGADDQGQQDQQGQQGQQAPQSTNHGPDQVSSGS